ncbi:hypothetical protein [Arthrobacter sp. AZCC_0090]|uniref:hypothetical protein n=1 Tax=Arthrobacter sp. AZCC_0090 TaxID=2735881 RepID=UPI00160ACE96|nr:hypothetical protein [Arthrobacter sp. AZCC_0090]MBB6402796.1 hypothetical protein [Arthrobacter sp. AZCC_0090]
MAAFEETTDQPQPAPAHGPVFVDASGRRLRRVKLVGLGALGLVAGYVVLLLVALFGGPNVAAPFLPLPAAPKAAAPVAPEVGEVPSPPSNAAGLPSSDSRLPVPLAPAAFETAAAPLSPVPATQAINGAAVQHGAAIAAPTPSASPTSPGKSGTAPGQTTRRSTPTHP